MSETDGNGRWSTLKWFIAANAIVIPPLIAWGSWLSIGFINLQHKVDTQTFDRLTSSMFVEIQVELEEKNPDVKWLTATEVRDIQRRNQPYAKQ